MVASIPKEAVREVLTLEGLSAPGTTAHFRLYVVLTTGNERGSETISISRP